MKRLLLVSCFGNINLEESLAEVERVVADMRYAAAYNYLVNIVSVKIPRRIGKGIPVVHCARAVNIQRTAA